ncbi:hypothetical protein [Burkholderia phage FLC10]|uniref:hypothetical protein n=1 Tax=Burkholderia phage FLC10 TaxID=2906468 RepID=UPI0023296EA7|nr:hypothetical protein PQA62_gp38 [Burkholderia phage FLC10]BDD79951.1 hypothetical protein [Burkholderia phage FLC10]
MYARTDAMRTNSTVMLAVDLSRNIVFRKWVSTFTPGIDLVTEDQAAMFIRYVCEIESRAELATNDEAVQRFNKILRRYFHAWRDEQHRNQ